MLCHTCLSIFEGDFPGLKLPQRTLTYTPREASPLRPHHWTANQCHIASESSCQVCMVLWAKIAKHSRSDLPSSNVELWDSLSSTHASDSTAFTTFVLQAFDKHGEGSYELGFCYKDSSSPSSSQSMFLIEFVIKPIKCQTTGQYV